MQQQVIESLGQPSNVSDLSIKVKQCLDSTKLVNLQEFRRILDEFEFGDKDFKTGLKAMKKIFNDTIQSKHSTSNAKNLAKTLLGIINNYKL